MGGKFMSLNSSNIWRRIESDYAVNKRNFGKKMNFVQGAYKRIILFRDVEQSYFLAHKGFSKPAVILVGSIIEELLRLYLDSRGFAPRKGRFCDYIRICEEHKFLNLSISKLTHTVREFRNLVHMQNENSPRATISKATAKSAIASLFTVIGEFESKKG